MSKKSKVNSTMEAASPPNRAGDHKSIYTNNDFIAAFFGKGGAATDMRGKQKGVIEEGTKKKCAEQHEKLKTYRKKNSKLKVAELTKKYTAEYGNSEMSKSLIYSYYYRKVKQANP